MQQPLSPLRAPGTLSLRNPPQAGQMVRQRQYLPPLKRRNEKTSPTLRWTPYAWAKLLCFCHRGDTEIAGFGISVEKDPLLIEDIALIPQQASSVHVCFDDAAIADYFDSQIDVGRRPEQFARVWVHTHPGESPEPSTTDEATFARVFGPCDWAIMFILARGGKTYTRLRFNAGPGGEMLIPVAVDYTQPFAGSEHDAWQQVYQQCVRPVVNGWEGFFGAFGDADLLDDLQAVDQLDVDLAMDQLDEDEHRDWLEEFELTNSWSGMLAGAQSISSHCEGHTEDQSSGPQAKDAVMTDAAQAGDDREVHPPAREVAS